MFKFLKKKHKRSDWMEGLLECEDLMRQGYELDNYTTDYIWFKNDKEEIQ